MPDWNCTFYSQARGVLFAGDDKEHDRFGGHPTQSKLDTATFKLGKKDNKEYNLYCYLVVKIFSEIIFVKIKPKYTTLLTMIFLIE